MIKLPAGSYYIGDPCYVIDRAKWSKVCHQHFEGQERVELDGRALFMARTQYGDGGYFDQHGNEYSVDSGTLAAVPLELCERTGWERLGVVITAGKPFTCSRTKRGRFRFGQVRIQT